MSRALSISALPLAAVPLALLLSSCAVGPNFVKPRPHVPARWSATAERNGHEGRSHVSAQEPQPLAWWSAFKDPQLTSLVDASAAQNLDVRQAALRIEEAQAEAQVLFGGLWPSLSANASWARQRISTNTPNGVLFSGAFAGALRGDPALADLITNPYNQAQLGLGASWELDLFGATRRGIAAANARTQAAVDSARGVLLTMVSSVAQTYISLRGEQLNLSILERSLATERGILKLTQDRYKAGLTSDLDVQNASAELNTTRAQLPLVRQAITLDINQLGELMDKPPEALRRELAEARPVPPVPPVVPIGLPSQLLRRRPDIREAEAQLHAATEQIGIAISEYFPSVTLTAAGGFQAEKFGSLIEAASHFAAIGPQINLPIFEGGRIRATVHLRRLQAKEAAVIYARTVVTALTQVEDALAAYGADQARQVSLQAAVKASRSALSLARQRYQSGVASFIAVLDAERTEQQSELSLADATTAVSADLVHLYQALGGGWEASARASAAGGPAAGG